jgi:hypothetical protein
MNPNTVTYTDTPGILQAMFAQAVSQFIHWAKPRPGCTLEAIRVVARFVTVVYVGGAPVWAVHWTSTVEGPPGTPGHPGTPGLIKPAIISSSATEGNPNDPGYASGVITGLDGKPEEK